MTSGPGEAPREAREKHRVAGRAQVSILVSAAAFSAAGFFTREVPIDVWATVAWRNGFGSLALLVLVLVRRGRGAPMGSTRVHLSWRAASLVGCSALGTICYLAAFKTTSVANIAIIYATAPLLTAALAWVALGETMTARTGAATLLALGGVALAVGGASGRGMPGDGLALAATLALCVMAVLARGATLPALECALAASVLAVLASVVIGRAQGASFAVTTSQAAWLAAFGLITVAVALPCYLAGARRLPAGQAMLLSAAEMPLAPLWTWLAFGDRPSVAALLGGALVAVALALALHRRPRATTP